MRKKITILSTKKFKPIRYLSEILIVLMLLRYGPINDRISHIQHSTTLLNILLLTTILLLFLTILYIAIKTKQTTTIESTQQIPCAPLILLATGLFVIFNAFLWFLAIPFLALIILLIGLLMIIQCLTTKLTITNDGIYIILHKIFPFPGIYYPKDTIQTIKTYSNIVSIKHNQKFLAPKLYVIINKKQFTKHLKTTTLQNLKT